MNKKTEHLIIPGLAKAGTTFLFDNLEKNTDVFNIPIQKELNFFSYPTHKINNSDYFLLFRTNENSKIFLDASPTYLQSQRPVSQLIKQKLPDARVMLIITVRDPAKAAISHYLHDLKSHVCRLNKRINVDSYSFFDLDITRKYFKDRSSEIVAMRKTFGDSLLGIHMHDLFNNRTHETVSSHIGRKIAPFRSENISNPGGWLPYYIYGGRSGSEYIHNGTAYKIPPRTLVLVSNDRSEIKNDVDENEASARIRLQNTFTREFDIPRSFFAPLVKQYHSICRTLDLEPVPVDMESDISLKPSIPTLSEAIISKLNISDIFGS